MNPKTHPMEKTSAREFVISREFAAPRELVWQAWTDPKQMARWWGPQAITNPVCEMDVRPGGSYRIVMRMPDGSEYPLVGVFLEVVRPARLVFTMDCSGHPEAWHDQVNPHRDGSKPPSLEILTTVTFEEHGGKTKLTVRQLLETAAIRDAMVKMGMTQGWSQSLDKLAVLLEKFPK